MTTGARLPQLPRPTPARRQLLLLLPRPPTAEQPQPLPLTPMVELSPLLLPLLQPLIPMEELLHLWSPSLQLLLWTLMAAPRLFQLRSSRTTLCWPSTMTTTPTTCLPTRWVEKDGPDDLEMTLPRFRLHPSHLTHMARAWTHSPELSRSLQTTPSRCSKTSSRPLVHLGSFHLISGFLRPAS